MKHLLPPNVQANVAGALIGLGFVAMVVWAVTM